MDVRYIKIIDELEITELLDFYKEKESFLVWNQVDTKGQQLGIQYASNQDPWISATDRVKIQSQYFFLTNPFFKDSVFESVVKKYKLFRSRLLWLFPKNCYSMHNDDTPRIHIPLVTNPDSFIVFKDGIVAHLEVGKVYWVNTRQMHTAMNGGNESRLHLVGCIN